MLAVRARHSVTFYLFDFNDVSVKYCINCVAVVNAGLINWSLIKRRLMPLQNKVRLIQGK